MSISHPYPWPKELDDALVRMKPDLLPKHRADYELLLRHLKKSYEVVIDMHLPRLQRMEYPGMKQTGLQDFSEHPMTIGEARGRRDGGGSKTWSVRECLVEMLRHIDSGQTLMTKMVALVQYRERGMKDEDNDLIGYRAAGDMTRIDAIGLCSNGMMNFSANGLWSNEPTTK